jgi:hypothetical protein
MIRKLPKRYLSVQIPIKLNSIFDDAEEVAIEAKDDGKAVIVRPIKKHRS